MDIQIDQFTVTMDVTVNGSLHIRIQHGNEVNYTEWYVSSDMVTCSEDIAEEDP